MATGRLTITIGIIDSMTLTDVVEEISETVRIMSLNGESNAFNLTRDFDRSIFDNDNEPVGKLSFRTLTS
jgi:hypothetical protein